MSRGTKTEDQPLERLLELIDEKVRARGEAELAALDATAEIKRLASEARRKGVTMPELAQRVKRVDPKTREWAKRRDGKEGISRQALDTMLAVHDERREPRTTRASRRRRETPAGQLNAEIFG